LSIAELNSAFECEVSAVREDRSGIMMTRLVAEGIVTGSPSEADLPKRLAENAGTTA